MKTLILAYGTVAYLAFFGTILYMIGFVGNVVVPKSIDTGTPGSFLEVLLIDVGLMMLFGVSHSVMARPVFKEWITQFIPHAAERSTFVLVASLSFILLYWQWRPFEGTIFAVDGFFGAVLFGISMLGWVLVFWSTFIIDHFDLFGLRQVWLNFRGIEYSARPFVVRSLYKFCRHPLMLGFLIAFWFTPSMTVTHLVFALGMTLYIFIGILHEERDLAKFLGEIYLRYKERTSMIFPWVKGD